MRNINRWKAWWMVVKIQVQVMHIGPTFLLSVYLFIYYANIYYTIRSSRDFIKLLHALFVPRVHDIDEFQRTVCDIKM